MTTYAMAAVAARPRPVAPPVRPQVSTCSFLVGITRRFPGTSVWCGRHTGSWWAFHPSLPYLVEATSPGELAGLLHTALRTIPAGGVHDDRVGLPR
ncbi:MAG: hypothetical protein JWO67_1252 [Streptosporangiaceae bacterium]|nr:hypothetical protein [Streptosporangiaceae bacterium]